MSMTTTTIRNADSKIAQLAPFDAGSLRGEHVRYATGDLGRLPTDERDALSSTIKARRAQGLDTYVVWSYATPIAWQAETGQLHVSPTRYSPTTTRHQSICRRAA